MRLDDLRDLVLEMIKEHDITVVRKRFKSPAGRAWVQSKTIKIPKMSDFQSVGTAVHEVAHIILGHDDDVLDYICEYDTERWTINFLKQCGMHIDYKSEFEIYFDEGISKASDILDLGVANDIIQKSGSWLSFENEKIGQGREVARKFLKENPKLLAKIEKQIIEKLKVKKV